MGCATLFSVCGHGDCVNKLLLLLPFVKVHEELAVLEVTG